jgi:hypothetical protein
MDKVARVATIALLLRNATRALVLLLALDAVAAAPLQSTDVFSVIDLPMEVSADNPAAARDRAIEEAQSRALRTLLERLTLPADHPRLPKADGRRLTQLVSGIEFADEKFSASKYLAKITVRFRPAEVRRLLNDSGLRFSETAAKPLLVLPVFFPDQKPRLWEEPNPWRDAWVKRDATDTLLTIRAPSGELADVSSIGAEEAMAGDAAKLETIRAKYDAGEVLVAEARMVGRMLSITLKRYEGATARNESDRYVAQPGELEEALFARAVVGIVAKLTGDWKQQSLITGGATKSLNATVPLATLEEWVRVRRGLAATAIVRSVEVGSLSRNEAQVTLQHAGEAAALTAALAQQDLELSESADGFWTLRIKRRQ